VQYTHPKPGIDMFKQIRQQFFRLILSLLFLSIASFGWTSSMPSAFAQSTEATEANAPTYTVEQATQIADLKRQAFLATQTGDYPEAEQLWTKLLDLLPEEAAIWSNRGNVRVALNQFDAAIADFAQSIQFAPDEPDPYLNRGATYEALEQWEKAIADYNRVLELNPDDAAGYNNRGNAEGGLGQWEKAIADYQKAIDLRPNYIFARANYAIALFQLEQRDEAMRILKTLARKHPNFADARAALTAALWADGKRGEAESNWVAVAGLDKRYKDINWVAHTRHWSPAMVDALQKFLTVKS
jgi:tetratricopeptide (TPR) repeat protein